MEILSIGQVAKRAGVGVETVRFYEREGLLEEPPRRVSGYRQYSEQVVTRLHFIKSAQQLGFSLKEISEAAVARGRPDVLRGSQRAHGGETRGGGAEIGRATTYAAGSAPGGVPLHRGRTSQRLSHARGARSG